MTFEKKLVSFSAHTEVETLYKKLQFLGLNFDPFQGEAEGECKEVMRDLGLEDQLRNPYQATNLLLRLLDLTEERLNGLKQ